MKRTLQWKFIRTAMMAVTVLLLVLLGAINLLNWWQVERQTDWMLQVLTQGDAPPVEPKRPEGFLPPLDADDKGAARFFQVFYDGTGQVAYVDVNQIATVTKETMLPNARDGTRERSTDSSFAGCLSRTGRESVFSFWTSLQAGGPF